MLPSLFFNKVAGLTPFSTEHFRWLLLKIDARDLFTITNSRDYGKLDCEPHICNEVTYRTDP